MNQAYKDILITIERHAPITTSEICERLSTLGYGGAMAWQDFRNSVSKQLCYLRDKGDIAGEDRPQAKGKPLRVWALAKAQEMASDVAEVEATHKESLSTAQENLTVADGNLTVADADMVATLDSLDTEREIQERQAVAETLTPEPEYDAYAKDRELNRHTEVAIEAYEDGIKAAHKPPMSVQDALAGKPQWMGGNEFSNFLLGIEFAEKHHGISQ